MNSSERRQPGSNERKWQRLLLGGFVLLGLLTSPVRGRASDPIFVSLWPGFRSGSAHSVAVQGNYAYVGLNPGDLAVFDISNPSNVLAVGGCFVGNAVARDVAVSGNYVYLTAGDAGLKVIDVSSPAKPRIVGSG